MSQTQHVVLNVPAVSCMHCKNAIEGAVRDIEGVVSVDVEVTEKTVSLQYDPDLVDLEELKDAIEEEGYPVVGEHVFGVAEPQPFLPGGGLIPYRLACGGPLA